MTVAEPFDDPRGWRGPGQRHRVTQSAFVPASGVAQTAARGRRLEEGPDEEVAIAPTHGEHIVFAHGSGGNLLRATEDEIRQLTAR